MKNGNLDTNKLFGRKKSRSTDIKSQNILKNFLPKYQLNNLAIDDINREIEFEIGFGYGEYLLWQAINNQEKMFIGAEPFLSGVTSLIKKIEERQLNNIMISTDNAINVLDSLADNCLTAIYILFPDPWPKKRHQKRRLVNPINTEKMCRVLRNEGKIYVASDHKDYIYSILLNFLNNNRFEWLCQKSSDFIKKPYPSTQSKYEKKAVANRQNPVYLTFKKISL